jgi:hypothetical protein
MKNLRWAILGAVWLVGCTTPAKVCKHLGTLDALPLGGEARCEVMWERTRQSDRAQYDKEAACVLDGKTKADAVKCLK